MSCLHAINLLHIKSVEQIDEVHFLPSGESVSVYECVSLRSNNTAVFSESHFPHLQRSVRSTVYDVTCSYLSTSATVHRPCEWFVWKHLNVQHLCDHAHGQGMEYGISRPVDFRPKDNSKENDH